MERPSAFLNGESETALSHIANACDQMLDFKETQRRRRRRGRALLESSSVSESSPFKDPCAPQSDMRDRAKQRSRMMNLTESAKTTMPSSDSFASGIADVTRRVLSDPCESTPETRGKGVDLVDALLADAETNALGDLSMSEEVSVNALGALSSAVAPAVPGYGDKNAALTYAKARPLTPPRPRLLPRATLVTSSEGFFSRHVRRSIDRRVSIASPVHRRRRTRRRR